MRYPSLCVLLLAACGDGEQPNVPKPPAPEDRVADGPALYATYCTSCHGETGDGQGVVQLDRPARSFKDGGFSFGNTVQALKRTIAVGIAGSPMPGFGAALNDEQLTALAEHVRALGPETIPDAGDAAIVVVGDRPRFVRGQLPPLVEGGPDLPRGLLVGTPDGLSWQYDIDTMRLLAVRQGEFVERTDWVGRGGTPLKPLGRTVDVFPPPVGSFRDGDGSPLTASLISTRVDGSSAVVTFGLSDRAGNRVATVQESGAAVQMESCSGYERRWSLERTPGHDEQALSFALAGPSDVMGGLTPNDLHWRQSSGDGEIHLYGITLEGGAVEDETTWLPIPAGEATWSVTTLLPSDSSALAKITEELNR